MKKKLFYICFAFICLLFMTTGCKQKETKEQNKTKEVSLNIADQDQDATFVFGLDSLKGERHFLKGFNSSEADSYIQPFIHEDLIVRDDKMQWQPNLASWETEDNQTYTFKLKKGIKWHNGEELTMQDWKFALETLASSNYEGEYEQKVQNIQGVQAFHDGIASGLAGVKIKDDYTAEVTFREQRVDNLDNLWVTPLPYKELENTPVDQIASDKIMTNSPVGVGPFTVTKVTDKEVKLTRFKNYWQDEARLKQVVFKEVAPNKLIDLFNNGELDLVRVRPEVANAFRDLPYTQVIEADGLSLAYIGFRLGSYDAVNGKVVQDFDKYDDPKLRKAMYYALDRNALLQSSLNGQGKVVSSPIPSIYSFSTNKGLEKYEYNKKKAESLLDEIGFIDQDGDGFREDTNGDPFVIKFTHYQGQGFKERADAIQSYWEDIGLKTELVTDQLVSYKEYEDMRERDDQDLEVFFGAYVQQTIDPSPFWHSSSKWNLTRWSNEESDQLLAEALSKPSFNTAHREEVYQEWQKLFNKELPALILWEQPDLYVASKDISDLSLDGDQFRNIHKWFKVK